MIAVAGLFYAFSLLLVAAGLLKLRDPRPTAGALRGAGLVAQPTLVRLLGFGEVAVGLAAIVTGSRPAAGLIAISYVAFAAFVVLALVRRLPLTSCGCFGKEDTPPSAAHLMITLLAALSGGAVAARPIGSLGDVLAGQPWSGIPLVLGSFVVAYLCYLILTALARTMSIVMDGASARGVPS